MTEWQKSSLQIGDEVKVPTEFFETRELGQKRLLLSRHIGETAAGLLIELTFLPPILSEEAENYHFKIFLNWASIFCGALKVSDSMGAPIRAVRIGG